MEEINLNEIKVHSTLDTIIQISDFSNPSLSDPDRNLPDLFDKLNPMGFNPHKILFLIFFYRLHNENQVFEYLTLDQFDKYKHHFIPEELDSNKCTICEKNSTEHHILSDLELKRAQIIYNSISHLKLDTWVDSEQLQDKFCLICCFFIPKGLMLIINPDCHEICLNCFKKYLTNEITNNKVKNMHCPHCEHLIEKELIQQIVDEPTYSKYKKFVENNQVLENPLLRFCPKCSNLIQLFAEKDKKATCKQCKFQICPQCNNFFHNNITCETILNQELKNWCIDKEVQRCPKCRILIEKLEGCQHVTCYICHYQFCWLCRGPYKEFHIINCPNLQKPNKKKDCCLFFQKTFLNFVKMLFLAILWPFLAIFCLPYHLWIEIFKSEFYMKNIRDGILPLKIVFVICAGIFCIVLVPLVLVDRVISGICWILIFFIRLINKKFKKNNNNSGINNRRNDDNRRNNNRRNIIYKSNSLNNRHFIKPRRNRTMEFI